MKTITKITAIVCIGILMLFSCKKGDTGAIGATGARGNDGTNGLPGTNGTNGTNGNANVKTQILNVVNWSWDGYSNSYAWTSVPILTQSITDSGAVMVYENTGGGGWDALPYSVVLGGGITRHYEFVHALNAIAVYETNSDNSYFTPFTNSFKLVCISANGRRINPNLDLKNYKAVKEAFNLED
jgi:hypothetical protein